MVITLHRLGFSYKKTKHVPSKANKEKQEEFLESYKKLRKELKQTEKIYFMDGVHPTHNSMPAYAWIKTGADKEIKSNTGRQQININGVYSPDDQEIIIRDDASINSTSTFELLKQIESKHPELTKIYIVRDNARYYVSKEVQAHVSTSRIEFVPLPSYSPNLNLIERLWKLMKKKVMYNKYYPDFEGFKNAIYDFFETGPLIYRDEIKSLLTENFHIFSTQ